MYIECMYGNVHHKLRYIGYHPLYRPYGTLYGLSNNFVTFFSGTIPILLPYYYMEASTHRNGNKSNKSINTIQTKLND